MYKIKGGIKLRELQKFGYKYVGNYNRGDQWLKTINIIVDEKNLGGILIQGIENSIKIIAEHFGIEYRVGKYFPKDTLAIIVDTERIYPTIETQFEQLDRKIREKE